MMVMRRLGDGTSSFNFTLMINNDDNDDDLLKVCTKSSNVEAGVHHWLSLDGCREVMS